MVDVITTTEETLIEDGQVENKAAEEAKAKEEYSADQQQLDQEKANSRRAREELSSMTERYESVNERASILETEIEELKQSNQEVKESLEAEQKAEKTKLADMDPELVDSQVIENIKRIEDSLKSQREDFKKEKSALLSQMTKLNKKTAQYESERAETTRQKEQQSAVDSVLVRVEDSLKLHDVTTPGQYRTEAMKMADELVDTGQRKRPGNIIDGIQLMEECYLKVIKQHTKKKGIPVDDGRSGMAAGVKAKGRKTGSLDEVAADMAKDKSWKDDES